MYKITSVQAANIGIDTTEILIAAARGLMSAGKYINAIRLVRACAEISLKDAKAWIDAGFPVIKVGDTASYRQPGSMYDAEPYRVISLQKGKYGRTFAFCANLDPDAVHPEFIVVDQEELQP